MGQRAGHMVEKEGVEGSGERGAVPPVRLPDGHRWPAGRGAGTVLEARIKTGGYSC